MINSLLDVLAGALRTIVDGLRGLLTVGRRLSALEARHEIDTVRLEDAVRSLQTRVTSLEQTQEDALRQLRDRLAEVATRRHVDMILARLDSLRPGGGPP